MSSGPAHWPRCPVHWPHYDGDPLLTCHVGWVRLQLALSTCSCGYFGDLSLSPLQSGPLQQLFRSCRPLITRCVRRQKSKILFRAFFLPGAVVETHSYLGAGEENPHARIRARHIALNVCATECIASRDVFFPCPPRLGTVDGYGLGVVTRGHRRSSRTKLLVKHTDGGAPSSL